MTEEEGGRSGPAAAAKRLFIFSLWYFPSHFGLHVVDIANAFTGAGYDVTIVTIASAAFDLPYFDPFREAFDVVADDWPRLVRLNVEHLEDRGAYNPRLAISHDSTFHDCRRQMQSGRCHLLHFFEMFLPYFNSETIVSSVVTSVLYAGNFITRIIGQRGGEATAPIAPGDIVDTLLHPHSVGLPRGGYRLRGADCIFSETRGLVRMLRSTRLETPSWWTSRPIFAAPVLAAPFYDIRGELDLPGNVKVLLYAGRAAKNARSLASILRLVHLRYVSAPVVLLLVGVSTKDFCAWPGAGDVDLLVRNVPFVSRAKLFGIMKAADVFVYPGLVDGYPKVISEAQLARLPVVAFSSPASGVPEIATDGDTALLVEVASSTVTSERENEQFAGAIARILTERALRDALVERAFLAAMRMDAPNFVNSVEHWWRHQVGCEVGPSCGEFLQRGAANS